MQAYTRLTKGPQRGQLIRLRMWQGDLICDILRLDEHGLRVYWTYLVLVPRKNSKSLIGSGLAIDGLLDEPGAEVYSCAADKDQAKLVFAEVRATVEMSEDLDAKKGGLFKVYRDAIEYPAAGSVYKALSSEAFTKEGLNPSRVLFDELHAQPNWELWNVMNQGSDTRTSPLIVAISTFGVTVDTTGQDSVCKAQYDYAKAVQSGALTDPRYGARIYETNPRRRGFNYRDPRFWADANPALGDFLHVEKMQAACRKMQEADFKTKRLDIWLAVLSLWLPDGTREAYEQRRPVPDGAEVVLAFDGSFSGDSTGLTVEDVADHHIDVVAAWERPPKAEGWRVDPDEVEAALRAAFVRWKVRWLVYDPRIWHQLMQRLTAEGYPCEPMPQGLPMIHAAQRFYEDITSGDLTLSGDPRLARHLDNVRTKATPQGPRVQKESPHSRLWIDLAVCAVMGHAYASAEPEPGPVELDGPLMATGAAT